MLPIAFLCCFAGTVLLYLASPQQRLRTVPLPTRARLAALACAAGGLAAWIHAEGPGAGAFGALTASMLGWVALPYLAWRFGPRGERR
jgi:hypothetical protein